MQDTQYLLDIIKNNSELLDSILPKNVVVYGVFVGGSRLFNLEVDYDTEESDLDLCIIVSQTDYETLKRIPARFYHKVWINSTRVHWTYMPVDFKNYTLEPYCGLEFWLTAALLDFNKTNFFIINNEPKIDQLINSIKDSLPELLEQFKIKYKNSNQLNEQDIFKFLHRKSYYWLLISSLLFNKNHLKEDLIKIKELKQLLWVYSVPEAHEDLSLSYELQNFVFNKLRDLKLWLST